MRQRSDQGKEHRKSHGKMQSWEQGMGHKSYQFMDKGCRKLRDKVGSRGWDTRGTREVTQEREKRD
jgi:hypothetical protein